LRPVEVAFMPSEMCDLVQLNALPQQLVKGRKW
jgi:hypothetical protein